MRRKMRFMILMLAVAVMISACGSGNGASNGTSDAGAAGTSGAAAGAETITVTHQLGKTEVKKNPQKVVVFDFGALDTLDKLGVEVAGVPQANIPSYLSKYKDAKYANVGSLKEPDFEAVSELAPDLIIISGRQSEAYKELSEIGPTIYMGVDTNDYMNSFKHNVEILGQIFGKEDAVKTELDSIDSAVAELHDKASASNAKGLVVLANEGSLSAYGPKSRFGLIHDVFGVSPVDSNIEVSTHGQSISYEYITEKNPDYLFVVDRGAVVTAEGAEQTTARESLENELVKKTNAYKNGHIVYLNPEYWYLSGGGLESVTEMINEVSEAM